MVAKKGIKSFPQGALDLECSEQSALELFQLNIKVGWGDCDPAQIVYTARIPEWILRAIEGWYGYCLNCDWYDINLKRGIGTPFVSIKLDFFAPITPEFELELPVYVSRFGNASLSHHVDGFQDNQLCFSGQTTACFVDSTNMDPIAVPPNMRMNIKNYIQNQGRTF